MKTYIKSTLFFIVVLTLFSCSKSNPITDVIDDDNPIGDDYFVKATINGTDYIHEEDGDTNYDQAFTVATETDGTKFAAFTGEFSDTHVLLIGIKDFTGTGAYDVPDGKGTTLSFILFNPSTGLGEIWISNDNVGSGVVNVTQYGNGTARGTFSFTGVNLVDQTEATITNGEFFLLLVE